MFPLFAPHFWEHHHGKIAFVWAALVTIPAALLVGLTATVHALVHTALLEYIPFILLLLALFTVASGIVVSGNLHGAPITNTVLLGIGTILASLIGTTGASMVMIRPVLRANDDRKHNVHVVVFFIFLVSNIGGSLTPLGDPPLFLGFLEGVDFFWTTQHLFPETLFTAGIVLTAFFVLDTIVYRREGHTRGGSHTGPANPRNRRNSTCCSAASSSLPSCSAPNCSLVRSPYSGPKLPSRTCFATPSWSW